MKILIVDDSPSICMFLTHALETESHTVTAVGTGEDGVQHVAGGDRPDLIIMDVELPGIDGFEATRQIRKNEGDNWCPIVYLSSHTEEKLIARGIDAGGDSYLTKPIKLIELTSMIKALERIANVRNQLTRANETLSSVLNTASDGIYMTDCHGNILSINRSACAMLGFEEQELLGRNVRAITTNTELYADSEALKQQFDEIKKNEPGLRHEMVMRQKSGDTFASEISVNFVDDDDGGIYIGIFHDISRRKAYENELEKSRIKLQAMNETLLALSYRDGLTGIHNRRSFDESITRELQQALRDQTEISLIMCDIDHFKGYNDTYGHQLGDSTLMTVARSIESSVQRPSDMAARYGGEEFVILLPQTDAEGAKIIAEKTRNKIINLEIPNQGSQAHQFLTLSLGTATVQPTGEYSAENLIQMADEALYLAKESGRNNVRSHQL